MLKINVYSVLVANILPRWWYIIFRSGRFFLSDLESLYRDSRGGRNTVSHHFSFCAVGFFELLVSLIKWLFLFNSIRYYKSLTLSYFVKILMRLDLRNFLKEFKPCNVDQWFYIRPCLTFNRLSVFLKASGIFSSECSYWQTRSSWFSNMEWFLLLCLIEFSYALSSLLLG